MDRRDGIVRQVNNLTREQVVRLLEWGGFACYDTESTESLRSALVEAIEAGDVEILDDGAGGVVAALGQLAGVVR